MKVLKVHVVRKFVKDKDTLHDSEIIINKKIKFPTGGYEMGADEYIEGFLGAVDLMYTNNMLGAIKYIEYTDEVINDD